MEKIITPLIDEISKGNYTTVITIILITFVFNLTKISAFFEQRKRVKIALLNEALKSDQVSEKTKKFFKELIETDYFDRITGISIHKTLREELLNSHERANGNIRFSHFKKSAPYLILKDNKLSIKLTVIDILSFAYNLITALLALVGSLMFFVFIFFAQYPSSTPVSLATNIIMLFLLILGFLLTTQCVPIISIYHVRKHLKVEQQEEPLPNS